MDDNEVYQPSASGHLDLKYRGWTTLQPNLYSFAHCLFYLDVSFNSLQTLPDEISSLNLLQEFNCSCNSIQNLPESIGSLEWLRVFKANGNKITTIPNNIGRCRRLEELVVSENNLTALPCDIAGCTALQSLQLQNNDLPRLPISLALLNGKLHELNVTNNNSQLAVTLPTAIHRDIDSIMWILKLQHEESHGFERMKQSVKSLQHDLIYVEGELSESLKRAAMLEKKKLRLEDDMKAVGYFLLVRYHSRRFWEWLLILWQEGKRAIASRLHDRL
ncbi:hypothetical protein ACHAXS_002142 [Conticribra weissflogii]